MVKVYDGPTWTEGELIAMIPATSEAQRRIAASPEFSQMIRERVEKLRLRYAPHEEEEP